MSRKRYPAYNSSRTFKSVLPCCICGKTSTHIVFLEWSFLRGEDEDYRVCGYHLPLAKEDPKKFVGMITSKEAK